MVGQPIHPPSSVTHCGTAWFTHSPTVDGQPSPLLPNLVVIRSTVLDVYYISVGIDEIAGHKLELVRQFRLNGVVESLAVLKSRAKKGQRDAVVLAFREAKVSVVIWDDVNHTLKTTSLHFFEGDHSLTVGRSVFPYGPRVAADPQGRCACLLSYANQLALLPAMDTEHIDAGHDHGASTSAATVGNSYVLHLGKMGIQEVRDFVFLHGYNEPVILILHEPEPTWPAKYRERKDTCWLTAVSVNLQSRIYPVIWSAKGLPSDAYKLVAARKHGALVLCLNLVAYYSQGTSLAVGVNPLAFAGEVPQRVELDPAVEVPSMTATKLARAYANNVHPECAPAIGKNATKSPVFDIELDAAQCSWLDPQSLIVALKSGQLILLQLIMDGNNVKQLQVSKCGGAPIVSCMSSIGGRMLFLGSRLGDSLLVQFTEVPLKKDSQAAGRATEEDSLDMDMVPGMGDEEAMEGIVGEGGLDSIDDDLQIFLPATSDVPESGGGLTHFQPHVTDVLHVTGLIRDMTLGVPPESGEGSTQHTSVSPQLVACAGWRRGGCLAVVRQGVVAECIIEVPIEDVRGVWALQYMDEEEGDMAIATRHITDSYLLVSCTNMTKLLEVSEENMDEVISDFVMDQLTIFAGSIFSATRTVQVYRSGLRVCSGPKLWQEFTVEQLMSVTDAEQAHTHLGLGRPQVQNSIKSASSADPLLLVLMDDGRACLLEGDTKSKQLSINSSAAYALTELPTLDVEEEITACALYVDKCLWLCKGVGNQNWPAPIYCVVCRRRGTLEIYNLPHMHRIFVTPFFPIGWHVVQHNPAAGKKQQMELEEKLEDALPAVVEVRLESFPPRYSHCDAALSSGVAVCGAPILFALLDDGSLFVYRAFRPPGQQVAFSRVEVECPGVASEASPEYGEEGEEGATDGTGAGEATPGEGGEGEGMRDSLEEMALPLSEQCRMTRFDGVGEDNPCSGVFISGVSPLWVVVHQGGIAVHKFLVDGTVAAMTPFSNINCPQGFILAMASNRLKICVLHRERLDCPWPCYKVTMRCTPNKIAWYPDARLYAVLCSRLVPYRPRPAEEGGGDTHSAAAYAVADEVAKKREYEEGHELRLMIPGSWTTPWLMPLEPDEAGLAVRAVHLRDQDDGSLHPLIAVGTSIMLGEDYPNSGRCILLQVQKHKEISSSQDVSEEKWEGKVVGSQEVRGSVNALACLDGCLLVGVGGRLELCGWRKGGSLTRMAFFDGPLYITSLNVLKSFVLFGDVHKGIHFVWYTSPSGDSADVRELVLLGKDFNHADVYSTEFLLNGSKLSYLFADGGKNIGIQSYRRDHPDCWNGRRLLSEGCIHIGHHVGRMVRMKMCCPDGVNRQAALYGTLDGGFGYMAPIWDDEMFDRLVRLQKQMVLQAPHHAGLNPAAFRMRYRCVPKSLGGGSQHMRPPPRDRILDGDLLWEYWYMDRLKQQNLAVSIGSSRQQVVEDLQSIGLATSFF
ncbi:unnamed protein product [Ostreobium quekettii]|uniref:Cleavage and polyadenylation specificity factor subunit 1 n=1 Tax=Ostreobium quekettii TaxID=121088 RepID=A0A8S1J682_9CHLO|nr:unnamed protein product [Ostreobium quekettii]